MSKYNLDVGINLNNRKLTLNIPNSTEIENSKNIAKTDKDNYIIEEDDKAYFQYVLNGEEINEIFYKKDEVNLEEIVLPDNFGTIIEIDSTAVLYEYIKRTSNEKVFVMGEDFSKEESMSKNQIQNEVEEQARNYGVSVDSIIGFDGDEIPEGYVEVGVNNTIVACMDDDYTIQSSDPEKLPLTKADVKIGNRLSLNNGEIVIGAGVRYIRMSAQVYFHENASLMKRKGIIIYKNNDRAIAKNEMVNTQYTHIATGERVIPVNENDVIQLKAYGDSGDKIKNYVDGTFLCVEVVDGDIDDTLEEVSNNIDTINGEVI